MSRLSAEGLAKRFGGVVALDGVDLVLNEGEVVGLLGPNGAGKTTLFNCLLGLERPDRGKVVLDGSDVTPLALHHRARLGMARTFQRVELFAELSVRDHLAVAARSASQGGHMLTWRSGAGSGSGGGVSGRRRWVRAAEAARVDEILDRLGLVAEAETPAASLSLGRVRLVELGRALATDPSVILADEPSSGLDDDERLTLASALADVAAGGTAVLLIEHDLDLVRRVTTRAYVMDAGTLVASGLTPAVLADPIVARTFGRSGT